MKSIKINQIVAIGLLMVLVVGFGEATKEQPLFQNYIEGEMRIVGDYPKVGEIFEVVYRIRVKEVMDYLRIPFLTEDYCAVIRCIPPEAAEIIGKDKFFFTGLTLGETKEFRTRCRILKPVTWICIDGDIDRAVEGKSLGPIATKGDKWLWLTDPETGQYGTKDQWLNRGIGVLGKYNNVEPQWFSEIDPTWEPSNRRIVQEMRKFEPALTDSEALCLHQDNYFLIINAIGDANATDEERIEHLLKADWLNAQRSGAEAKEKWFQDFMEKNKGKWGGNPNLNFFRDDSSGIDYAGNSSSSKDRITTTFIGT